MKINSMHKYAIESNLVDKIQIPISLESFMIVKAIHNGGVYIEYTNVRHSRKSVTAEYQLSISIDFTDEKIVAYQEKNVGCPVFEPFEVTYNNWTSLASYINSWLGKNACVLIEHTK